MSPIKCLKQQQLIQCDVSKILFCIDSLFKSSFLAIKSLLIQASTKCFRMLMSFNCCRLKIYLKNGTFKSAINNLSLNGRGEIICTIDLIIPSLPVAQHILQDLPTQPSLFVSVDLTLSPRHLVRSSLQIDRQINRKIDRQIDSQVDRQKG